MVETSFIKRDLVISSCFIDFFNILETCHLHHTIEKLGLLLRKSRLKIGLELFEKFLIDFLGA